MKSVGILSLIGGLIASIVGFVIYTGTNMDFGYDHVRNGMLVLIIGVAFFILGIVFVVVSSSKKR